MDAHSVDPNLPAEPQQPEEPQQNKCREPAGFFNDKLALRGDLLLQMTFAFRILSDHVARVSVEFRLQAVIKRIMDARALVCGERLVQRGRDRFV